MRYETDKTRRLIDQYLAKNGVTKIPMGKSAFDVEYIWDGFKLVSKEPRAVVQKQNRFMRRNRRERPVDTSNDKIRELFANGNTDAQIGESLGISAEAVKKRRHYMNLKGKAPATPEQIAKRLEKILAMKAEGMTQASIAKALGVSQSTVCDLLQQHKNLPAEGTIQGRFVTIKGCKVRVYSRRTEQEQTGADHEQTGQKAQDQRDPRAEWQGIAQQGREGTSRAGSL